MNRLLGFWHWTTVQQRWSLRIDMHVVSFSSVARNCFLVWESCFAIFDWMIRIRWRKERKTWICEHFWVTMKIGENSWFWRIAAAFWTSDISGQVSTMQSSGTRSAMSVRGEVSVTVETPERLVKRVGSWDGGLFEYDQVCQRGRRAFQSERTPSTWGNGIEFHGRNPIEGFCETQLRQLTFETFKPPISNRHST